MRYQDAFEGYPGERRADRDYGDQFDYWTNPDPRGTVRRTGGFASLGAQARTSDVFPVTPDRWDRPTSDYPTQADLPVVDGRPAVTGGWHRGADAGGRYDGSVAVPAPGRRTRGLLAGGVTGFLAAATAIGVANLAAAFVRPQASPIIAVGGAFIDRTPPALKNFAVEKFGENDKNMLLLGMYVTIALLAVLIGMIAWRYLSVGVAGVALFGAFGAFVAYTRPESRVTDMIPSGVGGIVGILALLLLARWAAQRPPASVADYYGTRRRASGPRWAA